MKKALLWLLLCVVAALAGATVSRIRHRRARSASRVSTVVPERASPKKTRPVAVVVEEVPVVASPAKRARPADLTRYSRFNFVARRMIDVPSTDVAPEERFSWKTTPVFSGAPGPACSPALVFPVGSAISAAVIRSAKELAMAVYGETSGLFPAPAARGTPYDPRNWSKGFSSGASGDLLLARRMIAETRKGNKRTRLAVLPARPDRPSLLAWYCCANAAEDAAGATLYPVPEGRRLHFFIRQEGRGPRKAPYLAAYEPVMSFGPFVNVGGGDVPAGGATYIDFYVLPATRR